MIACPQVREFPEGGYLWLGIWPFAPCLEWVERRMVPRVCQLELGHDGYHTWESPRGYSKYQWREPLVSGKQKEAQRGDGD